MSEIWAKLLWSEIVDDRADAVELVTLETGPEPAAIFEGFRFDHDGQHWQVVAIESGVQHGAHTTHVFVSRAFRTLEEADEGA